jgi:hypothetical protein
MAYKANRSSKMGYKVVDAVDDMRVKYGPRAGLEGPFNFSGQVLYYDPEKSAYYDPRTDFYVSKEEMDVIHSRVYAILKR